MQGLAAVTGAAGPSPRPESAPYPGPIAPGPVLPSGVRGGDRVPTRSVSLKTTQVEVPVGGQRSSVAAPCLLWLLSAPDPAPGRGERLAGVRLARRIPGREGRRWQGSGVLYVTEKGAPKALCVWQGEKSDSSCNDPPLLRVPHAPCVPHRAQLCTVP